MTHVHEIPIEGPVDHNSLLLLEGCRKYAAPKDMSDGHTQYNIAQHEDLFLAGAALRVGRIIASFDHERQEKLVDIAAVFARHEPPEEPQKQDPMERYFELLRSMVAAYLASQTKVEPELGGPRRPCGGCTEPGGGFVASAPPVGEVVFSIDVEAIRKAVDAFGLEPVKHILSVLGHADIAERLAEILRATAKKPAPETEEPGED